MELIKFIEQKKEKIKDDLKIIRDIEKKLKELKGMDDKRKKLLKEIEDFKIKLNPSKQTNTNFKD